MGRFSKEIVKQPLPKNSCRWLQAALFIFRGDEHAVESCIFPCNAAHSSCTAAITKPLTNPRSKESRSSNLSSSLSSPPLAGFIKLTIEVNLWTSGHPQNHQSSLNATDPPVGLKLGAAASQSVQGGLSFQSCLSSLPLFNAKFVVSPMFRTDICWESQWNRIKSHWNHVPMHGRS